MIRIAALLLFLTFTVTLFAQDPAIEFEKKVFNFGSLAEGDLVEHEFNFTNTGNAPLVITDVKSTCGCTVPNWTTDLIKPGETGTIKVVFNSNDRQGPITRSITVITNQKNKSINNLYITGTVVPEI